MSENQGEEDFEDLLNGIIPPGDEELRITENRANMSHNYQENQQPMAPAQRQSLRDLEAALGLEPLDLTSQVVQVPSNARADQAGSNFPLHAQSNRAVDDPANSSPGYASSIPLISNLPDAQQTAGNRLELNPPNSGLVQSNSILPQSSLPNSQQAAQGLLQLPPGLTLQQAHLILQDAALRARLQTAPEGMVQPPLSNDLAQVSLGLHVSSRQNVQYGETDRSAQTPQNLPNVSATINNSQVPNLNNTNTQNFSTPPRGEEHLVTHNQGAELNVSNAAANFPEDNNLLRPLGELSQLNEVHRINEVHGGCIEQSDTIPDDILERIRNSIHDETDPVSQRHQQGLLSRQAQQAQRDVTTRNSGMGIPMSSSEMNIQTGAMNQPQTSALHHTLNEAVRLLHQGNPPSLTQRPLEMNENSAQNSPLPSIEVNTQSGAVPQPETYVHPHTSNQSQLLDQLNAPILPEIPLWVNDQISILHQPNAGTHQPTFDNATTQQDGANPLLASQPPGRSDNQPILEISPDIQIHQETLNSADVRSDPQESEVNGGGVESEGKIGTVSHSDEHSVTLQWISDFIKDVSPPFIATLNELDKEESQAVPDVQNHPPGTSSHANLSEVPSEHPPTDVVQADVPGFRRLLGSSYDKVFEREPDSRMTFSDHFTRMRSENISHDEISKAIAIPMLPLLDEEMVLNSTYTGPDMVRWRAEERNSPTISRITSSIRQSAQGTVVLVETLFNQLFRLFRRSFLQREERVHLELTTLFLKNSRLEGETNCENDAKELICWLEHTFTRGHLAKLIQRLVIAIDGSPAMKFLVDRAKRDYNPRNTEMTVLGAFYELMSKQHDIMKTSQDLAKRKVEVDKNIRKVKKNLKSKGIKAPKTTYEKKKTRNDEPRTETDHGLIRTFNATKWMLIECTDSHYAYAQSVLEAAKLTLLKTKAERDETLEILNGGISSLEKRNATPEITASLGEMKESREQVSQRDVSVVESTVLRCFVETMLALGKVTVSALLRTIGKLPSRLALTLEAAGEELEKVRGMGGGEKPGVEDIVRITNLIEEEKQNNAKQQRIVSKKISYLQECQQLLNGGVDGGGAPA